MSLERLKSVYFLGSLINSVKGIYQKLNETIDYVNNLDSTVSSLEPNFTTYKALVTQSNVATTSGLLVVGKTYLIDSLEVGDDFANVGYISDGVAFVATGTTPTTWTNSTSVLNITDSLPVITELENNTGLTISFLYDSDGAYYAPFVCDVTKTIGYMGNTSASSSVQNVVSIAFDGDYIYLNTFDETATLAPDLLLNTPMIIEIYN